MSGITRRGMAGLAAAAFPAVAGAMEAAALNITENPFGPSLQAKAALREAVTHVERYPHAEEQALMARIAAVNGVTPAHVVISTGALELLSMISAFWTRDGVQLAPALTYDSHIKYAARVGAQTRRVAMGPDQQIDLTAMAAGLGPDVRLTYVCNPNNPTGLLMERGALREFCIQAAKVAPVVVDEAFIDMSPDPASESVVDLVRAGHDVVVVGTFSKSYALAAVRIGYAIAQPDRARAIRGLLAPSRNGPGLAAAAASYRDMAYLAASNRAIEQGRQIIYRACDGGRIPYLRSAGSYVWADFGDVAVIKRLAEQGVLLRQFAGGDPGWARVAVAETSAMAAFARALPKALG
ncbi:MAG TPA: histidinol-phosphate transaminase [Phenylobacterium sp.]|nr:histidinol-phosphate transaminase [Phenylobacterium sp.]